MRAPHPSHLVRCPLCGEAFELLAAAWCGHSQGHPSKLCPHCGECLCRLPDYQRPSLWSDPPAALRSSGFDKLFAYYL